MDFGSSFSFVFKDPDWVKKLLIMGPVTLIPVLGQLVLMGWMAEVLRRTAQGNLEPRLPDLDFGKQLGDGFKFFVVALVYSIPILIIYIPFAILVAVVTESSSSSSDAILTAVSIASICVAIFAILYGIVMALLIPAAYARTAIHGSISAGLKFGEVFQMVRANLGAYFMVFLGSIAASFVASLGSIACGVGVLLTVPFSQAMLGHLIGQAYHKSVPGAGTYTPPPVYNEPIPPAI